MELFGVNILSVLAAAVAAFVAGSIYYGVMAKPWMKAVGIAEEDTNMTASLFVMTFVCEFILALVLVRLVGYLGDGDISISAGVISGLFVWLGFIMTTMVVNHRYANRGWDLTLIDGAHWLIVVVVMGVVIGFIG